MVSIFPSELHVLVPIVFEFSTTFDNTDHVLIHLLFLIQCSFPGFGPPK